MARVRVRPMVVLSVVAAAAAAVAQSPSPPQDKPNFRTTVTYVEVDASITDASGRFVSGVRAEDLLLFEDGQRRDIRTCSFVDLPIRAATASTDLAATSGESRSNEDAAPGRLSVIVLDDLHTAPQHTNRARTIVRRYVENYVGPSDLVAILSTGASNRIVVDFTSSPETLLAAVERFIGRRNAATPPGTRSQLACFT